MAVSTLGIEPCLHGHYARWPVAAYQAYTLARRKRYIGRLGDDARLAVIQFYGDFQPLGFPNLVFHRIARQRACDGAAHRGQNLPLAAPDRPTRDAAQRAARELGRASWRESVGPYGYISVLAVPYK